MDSGGQMRRVLLATTVAACLMLLLIGVPSGQSARSARFVAAGDFGARTTTTAVLQGMKAASPSAALALGDLKYRDRPTEEQWCSYVKGIVGSTLPFQLVSGNHESLDVADGRIENFVKCLPNRIASTRGVYGKEYWMDFPATSPLVRVIQTSPGLTFSDGQWAYRAGDKHYNWLAGAIDGARRAGAKWVIVTAHKPCWSVGSYGCGSPDFYKLLLSKKVDLVLSGHEHAYMRTHQLASGRTGCTVVPLGSYDADCVRDRDNRYTGGGTVFAVVGTGGTPLRAVNMADSEAGYFASVSGSNRNPAYGFLDIKVGETSLSGSFVTRSGGPFSDSFTISKP